MGLKYSLRHWKQILNLLLTPLPTALLGIQRLQTELCAPLAIRFRIAHCCTRWGRYFKGLAQHGERWDVSKNLRASLLNDDLSNEPNFGWMKMGARVQCSG